MTASGTSTELIQSESSDTGTKVTLGCNSEAMDLSRFGGETPVVRPSMVDLVFPEVIFPTSRVIDVAGEQKIRELVLHHHELIWRSPLQPLFGDDRIRFERATTRTADFHVEMCGGPKRYTQERGHPHLRERHFMVTITEQVRETWLDLYVQALREVAFPSEVVEEYWRWIEALSIRMINRRTHFVPPVRVPFSTVAPKIYPSAS
jgi:hemoglobin